MGGWAGGCDDDSMDDPGVAGRPRPTLADLANPAILPDPYPLLARLRAASPFAEFDGALVVAGRYRDCSRVLREPRASSDRSRSLLTSLSPMPPPASGAAAEPGAAAGLRSFLFLDPPDHTRLRRLVSRAFTARTVAGLEPRIVALADELLEGAGAAGRAGDGGAGADRRAGAGEAREFDVVRELAYPLPVRIISELLGVPAADHPRFAGWSGRLAHSLQPPFGLTPEQAREQAEQVRAARSEFAAYFRELIGQRRARPSDDLLSELIRAEDDGQRLTERELIATCVLLLVAGHETAVSLISNAILALLRHPDQLALVRADPGLAGGAVEETLRYDAPVQLTSRVARGELAVGDVTAPDGAVILLLLAAAGRDPEVFADPDRFDVRRGRGEPGASGAGAGHGASGAGAGRRAGDHLAFGAGPHFCLGAPLARLEATVAIRAFAARVAQPELAAGGLSYRPNLNLRGPERLVVRCGGVTG
jgi:cytochrome P450